MLLKVKTDERLHIYGYDKGDIFIKKGEFISAIKTEDEKSETQVISRQSGG